MWEPGLPAVDDQLRQGDLLTNIASPRRGTMTLTVEEIRAETHKLRPAIVMDQCCTVDQKYTVLLGRVAEYGRAADDSPTMQGLKNVDPSSGERYAKYLHLLEPHAQLREHPKRMWVVDMVERLSIAAEPDQLAWLREQRVARMTPVARAHFRTRLRFHFGNAETDDKEALAALGLNAMGLPIASTSVDEAP